VGRLTRCERARLGASALAALLATLGGPGGVHGQPVPPTPETVAIPLTEKTVLGATRELRLEGFLYRPPAASGPLPVLVFNHGSTGAGRVAPTATAQYRYPEVARFFVERGWAVLIPMRRGRGASGGEYLERYDCDRAILSDGVERGLADVDAALAYVRVQPWADPARLVLGGMSRGGLLSVVYPSRHRTTARGVVSFAGGWTVERCDTRIGFNAATFAAAGRAARLPMLWLYAENDRNYGPDSVRAYHEGFVRAGGTATLAIFPPIGHDGHILLPGAVGTWQTAVHDFLARLGLGGP
jgi:dienelactone hydrolase